MKKLRTIGSTSRQGTTMVLVAMLVGSLGVLSFALVSVVTSANKALRGSRNDLNAVYVTEAAISHALFNLANGGDGNLGSEGAPIVYAGAEYWVEAVDMGSGLTSLVANGTDNNALSRLELVVRSNASAESLYQWAAFGRDSMTMDSNARTDSYDSTVGSYVDQEVNGSGSSSYANTNGDVGSNADVSVDSNVKVWGDLVPGPKGTATINGKAEVSGGTTQATSEVAFPPLEIPKTMSSGNWTVSGTKTLTSGDYAYDDLVVSGTLVIVGPATVVATNLNISSNEEVRIDATNGPVEIYVLEDFNLNSNSVVHSTTDRPGDVSLYLESDNIIDPAIDVNLDPAEVAFDSNSELYGTLYAPNAHVEINSNFRLYGSVVARSVHLDSNSRVHFDEDLLNVDADEDSAGAFETICWRILPDEEVPDVAPQGVTKY